MIERKQNRKIMVKKGQKWIDVTNRKVVIYGAGGGCFQLMNSRQLSNVEYVTASRGWGNSILLAGLEYVIQPPSILSTLDWDSYYLIISSLKSESEITKTIHGIISEDNIIIVHKWTSELYCCYEKIEDVFSLDSVCLQKMINNNLLLTVPELIRKFKEIQHTVFHGVQLNQFMPVQMGRGNLTLLFGNAEERWVLSAPGLKSVKRHGDVILYKPNHIALRRTFLKQHNQIDELRVYLDESGIAIRKYAGDQLDFKSQELHNRVLRKCMDLHNIRDDIEFEGKMTDSLIEWFYERLQLWKEKMPTLARTIEVNMNMIVDMFRSFPTTRCVCHDDLNCSNVVGFDGGLYFIDWDTLCMDDPFIRCGLFSCHMFYSRG